jgi:hypothetical protein
MAENLKKYHTSKLTAVVFANVLCFYGLAATAPLGLRELVPSDFIEATKALPIGLGPMLAFLIISLFPSKWKERIVFLCWSHPLPGSRAFTHFAKEDPRVDVEALARILDQLPTDPREQNRVWYKLYLTVEDRESVKQAHRGYLFFRDYTVIALSSFAVLAPASFYFMESWLIPSFYSLGLLLQLVLTRTAAVNHAERFVCNVLSIVSATGRKKEANE